MFIGIIEEHLRTIIPVLTPYFSDVSIPIAYTRNANKIRFEFDELPPLANNSKIMITNAKFILDFYDFNINDSEDDIILCVTLSKINRHIKKHLKIDITDANIDFFNGSFKIASVQHTETNTILNIAIPRYENKDAPQGLISFVLKTDYMQVTRGINGRKSISNITQNSFDIEIDDDFTFQSDYRLNITEIQIHWNIRINGGDRDRLESAKYRGTQDFLNSHLQFNIISGRVQNTSNGTFTDNNNIRGQIGFLIKTYLLEINGYFPIPEEQKTTDMEFYLARDTFDDILFFNEILYKALFGFSIAIDGSNTRMSKIEFLEDTYTDVDAYIRYTWNASFNIIYSAENLYLENRFDAISGMNLTIESKDEKIIDKYQVC